MIRSRTPLVFLFALSSLAAAACVEAQTLDTPMTRLRPIGSPSAVDAYRAGDRSRSPGATASYRETGYQYGSQPSRRLVRQAGGTLDSPVQQTAMLQQFDAPQLPGAMPMPGSFSPPPATRVTPTPALPATAAPPLGASVLAPTTAPPGLPVSPGHLAPVPTNPSGQIPSRSDLAPVATPQLNDGFATIDNCCCVSPPSSYVAATPWGECAPVTYQAPVTYEAPQAYVAPPAQIAAPVVLPGEVVPPTGGGVPPGPLVSFGQDRNPVVVGQGIIGQPVAYVPGQRFRNWIRYFFP